ANPEDGLPSEYLTPDGRLRFPLRISATRDDADGSRGEVWVIEPAGDWRICPLLNGAEGPPRRQGKLTAPQRAVLARHLEIQDLFSLPGRLGPAAADNPYRLRISFGFKTATYEGLRPGALGQVMPPRGDEQAFAWSRFIAIVLVVEDLLKEEKP